MESWRWNDSQPVRHMHVAQSYLVLAPVHLVRCCCMPYGKGIPADERIGCLLLMAMSRLSSAGES